MVHITQEEKLYLNVFSGLDSSSQPLNIKPSSPATQSTSQRSKADDLAENSQVKAALKEVIYFFKYTFKSVFLSELNLLTFVTLLCLFSQLDDAFTLYKTEKAENDRMLNETNDKLRNQLTELQSSHTKSSAQLEFVNKRSVGVQISHML